MVSSKSWLKVLTNVLGLPQRLRCKESTCTAGDTEDIGSIPGSGGSFWEGNGNTLQYSCLGNPTDRGDWKATKSQFQRVRYDWSDRTFPCTLMYYIKKRNKWDVLREQHWNKYTIKCKTDRQPWLDAWDKCSGLVHWEDPEGWDGEGSGRGGIGMGNTWTPVVDSSQCIAKTTPIL